MNKETVTLDLTGCASRIERLARALVLAYDDCNEQEIVPVFVPLHAGAEEFVWDVAVDIDSDRRSVEQSLMTALHEARKLADEAALDPYAYLTCVRDNGARAVLEAHDLTVRSPEHEIATAANKVFSHFSCKHDGEIKKGLSIRGGHSGLRDAFRALIEERKGEIAARKAGYAKAREAAAA